MQDQIAIYLPSLSVILTSELLIFPRVTPQGITDDIVTLNISKHSTILSLTIDIVKD